LAHLHPTINNCWVLSNIKTLNAKRTTFWIKNNVVINRKMKYLNTAKKYQKMSLHTCNTSIIVSFIHSLTRTYYQWVLSLIDARQIICLKTFLLMFKLRILRKKLSSPSNVRSANSSKKDIQDKSLKMFVMIMEG
jgi:hypothetical protein